MHKIFVMYRLKKGVDMDQYKQWSKEIDQRITPGQPGMIRFEVYEIKGSEKDEPFVEVVEDIEVEDFEAWMETCRQPGMAYVIETLASSSTSRRSRSSTASVSFPICRTVRGHRLRHSARAVSHYCGFIKGARSGFPWGSLSPSTYKGVDKCQAIPQRIMRASLSG